jgi:hypothetical protein
MDDTLISRAVQSEFRTAMDLLDRIGGGEGPAGGKAVAPTGQEFITLTIPEAGNAVSILGETLTVERAEGTARSEISLLSFRVFTAAFAIRPAGAPRKVIMEELRPNETERP